MNPGNHSPAEQEQSPDEPAPFKKSPVEPIKVYERPERRSLPLWLIVLLVFLAFAASWFIFQALR